MDIRQKALSAYQRAMGAKDQSSAERPAEDDETGLPASESTSGGAEAPEHAAQGGHAGAPLSKPAGGAAGGAADGAAGSRRAEAGARRSGSGDSVGKAGETPREGLIKTGAKGGASSGASSGGRLSRVARFLVLLGTEEAAKVMRHLPQEEVSRIVEEIARTDALSASEARRILAEFGYRADSGVGSRAGGRERAREILARAFGEERAETILKRSAPESLQERFYFLHDLEAHQVEHLLRKESTHVRAMIIAQLPPALAAAVLGRLEDDEKRALSLRIARMGELSPEVVDRVAELLKERIRKEGVPVTEELDGPERLAEILRHMGAQAENALLSSLREANEDLVDQVEQRLYSIDIIHDIPDDQLERVLRRVDDQEIALLLKGKAEEFRSKLLRNLSDRRQRIVVDEYHHLGPVRRSDVEQANKDFVELLKRLAEEGEIVATWRGDDYT